MFADFRVGVSLAFRFNFFLLAGASFFSLLLVVWMSSEFSGRQPATIALDVGLSVMRLILPLVMVLVVQELLSREFDRRYFLSSLAYPRARQGLLLGRFASIILLMLGVLIVMAAALGLLVAWISEDYAQATSISLGWPYIATVALIGLDLLVLTALATFLAMVASTPSFVLIGTFGFMLMARSFAAIVELLTRETWVVEGAESYRAGVGILGYLLPDLGALDIRMVALYGRMEFLPSDLSVLVVSCLAYAFAFLWLAVWVLQRKRFA
ncbi:hypothetical protein N5D41_09755 [Pseudomonas toyotomiensis]|uniref:ABC transporter permease n=1 Tax=Ectopseudomonas toyotomiensis TaxID=554344 RepID=A0AA42LH50_9GAMM|nr:hypothetical protein [Pseudomonas toyotomiensis]MDH0701777.1 hypothetical protein [Pseudomonas toyotomiensis]